MVGLSKLVKDYSLGKSINEDVIAQADKLSKMQIIERLLPLVKLSEKLLKKYDEVTLRGLYKGFMAIGKIKVDSDLGNSEE